MVGFASSAIWGTLANGCLVRAKCLSCELMTHGLPENANGDWSEKFITGLTVIIVENWNLLDLFFLKLLARATML